MRITGKLLYVVEKVYRFLNIMGESYLRLQSKEIGRNVALTLRYLFVSVSSGQFITDAAFIFYQFTLKIFNTE